MEAQEGCRLNLGGVVMLDDADVWQAKDKKSFLYRTKYGEWVVRHALSQGTWVSLATHRYALRWLWENGHTDDALEYDIEDVHAERPLSGVDIEEGLKNNPVEDVKA